MCNRLVGITGSRFNLTLYVYDDSSDEDIPGYNFAMTKASNSKVHTLSLSKASASKASKTSKVSTSSTSKSKASTSS
ncbi:hypothetical protein Tco_0737437 [Tanacetum coccineum]